MNRIKITTNGNYPWSFVTNTIKLKISNFFHLRVFTKTKYCELFMRCISNAAFPFTKKRAHNLSRVRVMEWVSDCCLTPTLQCFSYIMARTRYFSMRW